MDALLERPTNFELSGRVLSLYPQTLGKSYMISSLVEQLNINPIALNKTPGAECLRLAVNQHDIVSLILTYSVCKGRDELFNSLLTEDLTEFFNGCDPEDCATLLYAVLFDSHVKEFCEYYGIDREHKYIAQCQLVKKDSTTLTFCGKSPWGSMIDWACERYGWSVDYVLWGVSYTTLRMLMEDNVRTIFLSEDERKKVHIPRPCDEIVDVNNSSAADIMAALNIKQ